MFRNILVPTDGSPVAARAIRRAVQFAKEQNARVTGFYAAPAYRPEVYADFVPASFMTPKEYDEATRKTAERYLAVVAKAAQAAGVACSCVRTMGNRPYEEILKAARRYRCDLIFMASHGRSGIAKLLLGSETAKVLAHSRIPVLICR